MQEDNSKSEKMSDALSYKNMYALLEARHGKERQKMLSDACVGIAGLGGLGSHVAVLLARLGLKKLVLVDFDCVDASNLHRQNYEIADVGQLKVDALKSKLMQINPFAEYENINTKLNPDNIKTIFKNCSIICEAFDVPSEKAMLTETVLTQMPNTLLVGSSGMAGISNPNTIKAVKKMKNYYLCGDGISDVKIENTLYAPRVALCASMQATIITQLILNEIDL